MTSSPERIAANQANAQLSTGPRTAEGKQASRANGLKHGLSGQGIVVAQAEAREIAERARRMRAQMKPVTEVGLVLLDRMAMLSVRLDRCMAEELERLAAMNDGDGGQVDLSKEGMLAFRYDQAAQANYHKAHAEFRRVEAEAKAEGVLTPLPARPARAPVPPAATAPSVGSSCIPSMREVFGLEPEDPWKITKPARSPNLPDFTSNMIPISAASGPDKPR